LSSRPRFEGPARRRAARLLDDTAALFRAAGYRTIERRSPLEARISGPSHAPLVLRLVPEGRIFGGTYGLEVSTLERPFARSAGLSARGRGIVHMRGVRFRPRRGDETGRRLAERLGADPQLAEHLSRVHFERIRVEPDGRPVIRHMGGSLVWLLFPPLVKRVPLVPEQVAATIAAMQSFVEAKDRLRAS
jgi:hypothetical protein